MHLISEGRVSKVSNMMSAIEKYINIIALNRLYMLTSSGDEDIVTCDPRLRVRFCIVFDISHVRVGLCLDEICEVLLRRHDDGKTDIGYRSDSTLL